MGEARPLGQEPAQLHPGVEPRLDPAHQLHDEVAPEGDGAIGLLGRERLGLETGGELGMEPAQAGCGEPDQTSRPARKLAATADHIEQGSAEVRVPDGVVEDPVLLPDPHDGDDGVGVEADQLVDPVPGGIGQGQEIGLGVSDVELDLDQDQAGPGGAGAAQFGDRDDLAHRDALDPPGLLPEPASFGDVGRKDLLQAAQGRPGQDPLPPVGDLEDGARNPVRLVAALQGEPVEAVGTEGDEVGEVADGRELAAAEELDRHGVAELGEVQLNGLGVAGEVDDDEDALVLVGPEEGSGPCGCPTAAARGCPVRRPGSACAGR